MGQDKQTQNSSSQASQTQVAQPTAEETALNKLYLNRETALDPQITDVQSTFLNLAKKLGTGEELPGYLKGLPGGIDEPTTKGIVDQSIRDIQPTFQQSGLLDSGVNASVSARTAGDIRTQAAQFNIQNLSQLLNLALGGQAQVQQPILGYSNILSNRLQGLRSVNSTGSSTGSQTTIGMNPFLRSFQTSLGNTLGSPRVSAGPFGFGG